MTEFIILDQDEIMTISKGQPVKVFVAGKPYTLCSDAYFEKQKLEVWRGMNGYTIMPKGSFDRIWEGAEEDDKGNI